MKLVEVLKLIENLHEITRLYVEKLGHHIPELLKISRNVATFSHSVKDDFPFANKAILVKVQESHCVHYAKDSHLVILNENDAQHVLIPLYDQLTVLGHHII